MKFRFILPYSVLLILYSSINLMLTHADYTISSPEGQIQVEFFLDDGGAPFYTVSYKKNTVLEPSRLGFHFKDDTPLNQDFVVKNYAHSSLDQTWEQPWGEVRFIREHYNEIRLQLQEGSDMQRELIITLRVFDDGLGLRFEFPEQPNLKEFQITDEQTEFNFAADHQAWWIPAYGEHRYEYLYRHSPLSDPLPKIVSSLTAIPIEPFFLVHLLWLSCWTRICHAERSETSCGKLAPLG